MEHETLLVAEEEIKADCCEYPGLENLGNTCFLNSVLQVLAYCPNLAKNLRGFKSRVQKLLGQNEATNEVEYKLNFFIDLEKIVGKIKKKPLVDFGGNNEQHVIKPGEVLESLSLVWPLFEWNTQQDAHECLSWILNILNDVINLAITADVAEHKLPPQKDNLLKLFGGRTGDALTVVQKQNSENIDPSNQNKKYASISPNTKVPVLKISNKKMLATTTTIAGKKYSPVKINRCIDSTRTHTPTGGCYERFKRKRFNSQSKTYNLKENQMKDCNDEPKQFYSKLSPPVKRKRTALFKPDTRKPLSTLKARKLFPIRKFNVPNKFFSFKPQHKLKNIISNGDMCSSVSERHYEVLRTTQDTNFINELFCGELANTNKCLECETSQTRKENFMDLSLPVKEAVGVINDATTNTQPENLFEQLETEPSSCSLSWSLNEFTKAELLTGENMYSCERCQRLVEASQCVQFLSLPSIMNIHLKRFSTQILGNESPISIINKNNISFTVPKTCSLKEWCTKSCNCEGAKYKLFAIIVHRGSTMFSGHYLSYVCVGGEKDVWVEADDDKTRTMSTEELNDILLSTNKDSFTAHTPYMLFYHKVQ